MIKKISLLLTPWLFSALSGCSQPSPDADTQALLHVEPSLPQAFEEHRKHFEPKVYQIGGHKLWSINNPDNWAANSVVVEGEKGLIVYDTGLTHQQGEEILAEIRKFSDKPITTIFYSHHHPDHYGGTTGLVSEADVKAGKVKIYAWHNFVEEMKSEFGATAPAQAVRVVYYGGMNLAEEEKHYHGCCGKKYFDGHAGYIPPTDTFSENTRLTIEGIDIEVFYTGGEAKTEFGLYFPKFKAVTVGDEIFHSVPNIYTIRGAKFREPEGYIRAVDTVLGFDVEHLLGSHLVPISGKEKINKTITKYRDLVQWINDQSIRYINKGYGIEELKAQFSEVPEYLENGSFSSEMYGSFRHIAPQMFAGLMGYFSGDAIEYKPTKPVEFARRHIKLMGGRDKVYSEAKKSYLDEDFQFAAELLTYLIRVDHSDMPARQLKAAAFKQMGYAETNTTWRSWYLTSALELEGKINPREIGENLMKKYGAKRLDTMSALEILDVLRYRVKAEDVGEDELTITYHLTDTNEKVTTQLRNGVLLVSAGLDKNADASLTMSRDTFIRIAKKEIDMPEAMLDGLADYEGSLLSLRAFGKAFDEESFMERLAVR